MSSRLQIIRQNNRRSLFVSAFLALFILSSCLAYVAPTSIDHAFSWGVLAIVGANLLLTLLYKLGEPRPINWLTPDVVFTTSYVIVHFLYMFMWLTQVFDLGETDIWYFRHANCPEVVGKTLAMCAGCLSIFNLGYIAVRYRFRCKLVNPVIPWQGIGKGLARLSLLLLSAFVVLLGGAFWGGIYRGTTFGFLPNIIFQVFQGAIVAAVAVMVVSRASLRFRTRRAIWVDTILIAISSFAILIHGDRSTFLIIILAIVAAYSEFVKPIKLRTGLLAFAGLFLLLGISGLARHAAEGRSLASFLRVANESFGESAERTAVGFSGSVLCAFVAVDYVPEQHDYFYGRLKTNSIAGLLPFGRRLFAIEQTAETSSSVLCTRLIQGRTRGVSGTGTSIFGDLYFDGGYWFAVVGFLGFGLSFKWISEKSKSTDDLRWKVASVALVSVLAISGRMQVLDLLIRQVAYPVLYVVVFLWFAGLSFRASKYVPVVMEP